MLLPHLSRRAYASVAIPQLRSRQVEVKRFLAIVPVPRQCRSPPLINLPTFANIEWPSLITVERPMLEEESDLMHPECPRSVLGIKFSLSPDYSPPPSLLRLPPIDRLAFSRRASISSTTPPTIITSFSLPQPLPSHIAKDSQHLQVTSRPVDCAGMMS